MIVAMRLHLPSLVVCSLVLAGSVVLQGQTRAVVSVDGVGRQQPRRPPLPTQVLAHPIYESLYTFVADHVRLVKQMPCYCGCDMTGHSSLAACFLAQSKDGRTLRWSTHAINCGLCITMAQDVQRLHDAHRSPQEIKQHLETAYRHLR